MPPLSSTATTPWAAPATSLPSPWTYQGSSNGSPTPSLVIGSGRLSHVLNSTANTSANVRYVYDLVSGGWALDTYSMEIVSAPSGMRFFWGGQTIHIGWERSGTNLNAIWDYAGSVTTYVSLTYDAAVHKYWRFRLTSGYFHWETSPDASTWTSHYNNNNTYAGIASGFAAGVQMYWNPNQSATATVGTVNATAVSPTTTLAVLSSGYHLRNINR